ncbi:MAG: DNA polymerase III subunit gamma/tau [Candidatus Eremiobacteraeota bacterium]|nr:DNA polymerase III subunit gamma/tau [Candidatus Eremiobacteraeota bacterium]
MSLYRTWRPKSFDDLVGQDAVVRTLRSALSSGRLAHAYLFSGPRGSGKTSAAKILARCIECLSGPTPDPDNTCENCLAILSGTALDVQEIDAASNRGIDEIRALRDSVKFAPAAMRYKVFVIDEAHMLTREGANAFLKTLEEPPPHAVFILATTAPEALPPTILSRCQRYAFRRIAIPTMIERMTEIAAAEGIRIEREALAAIAYRADGGLRDALTMLEQVAAFAGNGLTAPIGAETVEEAFGTTGRAFARSLAGAILAGDAPGALRAVDEASDAGTDMHGLIRATIGEYRHLLVARLDPELLSRDLAPEDAAHARRLAEATPQAKIVRGLRLLAEALAGSRLSGNPRLELETAVLRLVAQADDPTLDALAARVAELEERSTGTAPPPAAKAPAASKAPSPPPAVKAAPAAAATASPAPAATDAAPIEPPPTEPGAPSLQQIRSLWDQIRTRVYEEKASLRAPLSRATVDAFENGVVTIGLVDEINESLVREKASVLEAALADVLRTKLRVAVRSGARARVHGGTSAHRAAPNDPPAGSPASADDESDLMAYARKRLNSE